MNVAELFVKLMENLGTDKCFCVTGGMAMYINQAFAQSDNIQVVYTHHEQSAACAAEGFTMARNFVVPGLCVVTSGPGVTNALTGILTAYIDSSPVVIFAGQVKEEDIDTMGLRSYGVQEVNSKAILSNAVKDFIRVSMSNLEESVKAFCRAISIGRKGPVLVEIPLNVQSMPVIEADNIIKNFILQLNSKDNLDQASTDRYADIISQAIKNKSKITLYLGNGVRISGACTADLIRISEKSRLPRFFSWMSQDLDSYKAELNFGCPGNLAEISSNQVIQDSDLTIFLGARLDLASTAYQADNVGGGQRVLIDIDPRELAKLNREDDIKICADINDLVPILKDCFSSFKNSIEWVRDSINRKDLGRGEEVAKLDSGILTVRYLAEQISGFIESGTIVMSSSGYASETLARFYRSKENVRFFHGGGLGAMGQGLSQGIGAICARKSYEDRILIVESDGGLWMAIHELMTLKTIDLRNTLLINMNNGGYASIFNSQTRVFDNHHGTNKEDGLALPDWQKLIEAMGFRYRLVSSKQELNELIEEGFTREFTFVDFIISKSEPRGPQLKTIITSTGPRTQPFGELNW